jgi:hypothetical protein
MDAELLKTVGQVAGIGGVALGVFLLIFRELIRKAVLPKLTREDFRLILVGVWSIAVLGIIAWVWTETRPNPATASGPKVEAKGGVAAGRDIKRSTITIGPSGSEQSKGEE